MIHRHDGTDSAHRLDIRQAEYPPRHQVQRDIRSILGELQIVSTNKQTHVVTKVYKNLGEFELTK